ncbi:tubulin polyglutamylase complex subunit 2 isoform X1 [Lepisosteus oculatus]|uniref:tubulin polyglutamylase complex subunit 2 isoform X1 n=1 Tax=Lepisosteus oculatus TaxID=7918 RepID=UPI0003EAD95E
MDEVMSGSEVKEFVERLTLGITRVLESFPGVTDVRFVERGPAERHTLQTWEQRNSCVLPEDLKDFYLTMDGFQLSWSSKLDSEPVPLGSMVINSVLKLQPLCQSSVYSLPSSPTLADLDYEDDGQGNAVHNECQPAKPHFDSRSRVFELDPCNGSGRVCLVYTNAKPGAVAEQCEVWFLDRALYWHFLAASFTAYYRLMITHLGLPEWQYRFTPYGPSPQAKQWACLYRPLISHGNPLTDQGEPLLNKLDPNRAFRGKTKQPLPKKKPPAQTGGGTQKTSTGTGSVRHAAARK